MCRQMYMCLQMLICLHMSAADYIASVDFAHTPPSLIDFYNVNLAHV